MEQLSSHMKTSLQETVLYSASQVSFLLSCFYRKSSLRSITEKQRSVFAITAKTTVSTAKNFMLCEVSAHLHLVITYDITF